MPMQEGAKDHAGFTEMILTDRGICENDEKTRVIYPLNLETSVRIIPFGEGSLDVPCLKLLGEACEGQDACNACRQLREGCCHVAVEELRRVVRGAGGLRGRG